MSRRLPAPVGAALVRARLFAIRYRAVYWLAAVTLAVVAATWVHGQERRADEARRGWGTTRSVLVLAGPTEAGTDLTAAHVTAVEAPDGLVPDTAVRDVDDGRVTRVRLGAGTMLVDDLLVAPDDALAGGRRGVALPVQDDTPPLAPGAAVDLVGAGTTLADDARVVRVLEDQAVIAVEADRVAAVAEAARRDDITIVLRS